jgi:hypothetical protein
MYEELETRPDKRTQIAWDYGLDFLIREKERISKYKPCEILKFKNVFFLYYIGGYYDIK